MTTSTSASTASGAQGDGDDDRSPRGKADPAPRSRSSSISTTSIKRGRRPVEARGQAGAPTFEGPAKFPKLKELNDIFEDLDLDGDGHVLRRGREYIDERVGTSDDRKASRSDDDDDDDADASRRSGASWALNDDEHDGPVDKLRWAADGARVPSALCSKRRRGAARQAAAPPARQGPGVRHAAEAPRARGAPAAAGLVHRPGRPGQEAPDLRELEDAEPELFEEGTPPCPAIAARDWPVALPRRRRSLQVSRRRQGRRPRSKGGHRVRPRHRGVLEPARGSGRGCFRYFAAVGRRRLGPVQRRGRRRPERGLRAPREAAPPAEGVDEADGRRPAHAGGGVENSRRARGGPRRRLRGGPRGQDAPGLPHAVIVRRPREVRAARGCGVFWDQTRGV